jgi:hypothetical protein
MFCQVVLGISPEHAGFVGVAVALLPSVIVVLVGYSRWLHWPCPRCGQPFSEIRLRDFLARPLLPFSRLINDPLRRRYLHCELRLGDDPSGNGTGAPKGIEGDKGER